MKHITILVLGATMTGIAIALTQPKDVLVIERTMLLGPDYLGSMNIKRCRPEQPRTALALGLQAELVRRNLMNDAGEVHGPRLAGVLANRLRQRQAQVMLLTEVVSIKFQDHGFEVILYNADGYTALHTGRIIDTTAEGYCIEASRRPQTRKYLCAALAIPAGALLDNACPTGGQLLKGRFSDEYILKVLLDDRDDWTAARARLNDYWQNCRPLLPDGCAIAAIADELAVEFMIEPADHFELEVQDNWHWLPSASYQDLLSAFEGGARCWNAG